MGKHPIWVTILWISLQLSVINAYVQTTEVAAGVTKISFGVADKFTPYGFCSEKPMTDALK